MYAGVLVACLANDAGPRVVYTSTWAAPCAPPFLFEETQRLLPKTAKVAPVNEGAEAQERCREADAWGDDEYVALALALDAPVWTLDKDFARIRGVRTATTEDLDVA